MRSESGHVSGLLKAFIVIAVILALGFIAFKGIWFYNESGYITHVRTIGGEEKVVENIGYETKWFGKTTQWKKALSVQSVLDEKRVLENSDDDLSANTTIPAFPMVFLGNVDAKVEFSARFKLPSGDQFLKIAQDYRSPENFINTALIPALKETLQSTASLMSADDYYAGARSEFAAEFENQLNNGIYLIRRKEVERKVAAPSKTAILQDGSEQGEFGDGKSIAMITEKIINDKGIPVRKSQQFRQYDVDVIEARITNVQPNQQYLVRMTAVQKALAELAVARQSRLKEEEEKLLVTARGQKEVEQKRQETLKEQIEKTTRAETEKQLTKINAEREKQKAKIEKDTAGINLEKARIEADAVKVTADAEAYAKNAVITADGALDKKLAALVTINQVWAEAASKAPVPSVMMGGGQGGNTSRQDEMNSLMQILAVKAAKDLSVDTTVKK